MRKYSRWLILLLLLAFVGSMLLQVLPSKPTLPDTPTPSVVEENLPDLDGVVFNSDAAYKNTEKIVSMSPRISGSAASIKVKAWIIEQFKAAGCDVKEQSFKAVTTDNRTFNATNIIARYNPTATKRVMLSAHWDSRDVADQDKDVADQKKPILGADDAASGVGTLLEIAAALKQKPANIGVDFVLFDAEDLGDSGSEDGWCLGSKHFAKNMTLPTKPIYGILLDMSGARGARFTLEQVSMKYAPSVVAKVWKVARQKLGYTNYFVMDNSRGPLIDDHVAINEIAKIPMIDIINHPADSFFGSYWHTSDDNMSVIDKETLNAVGRTLLYTLHYEANNIFK